MAGRQAVNAFRRCAIHETKAPGRPARGFVRLLDARWMARSQRIDPTRPAPPGWPQQTGEVPCTQSFPTEAGSSACTSATVEPSYVLRAIGLEDELAHSSLRFTVGRFTTEAEIDFAAGRVLDVVERLRAASAA